jgi:putative ABC transport system ATP-binding protein
VIGLNAARTLVVANDVWKIYGYGNGGVEALKGVSLEIAEGEMVAIMGPSGCGKTTLLNCLAGLDDISGGQVWMDGQDQFSMTAQERDAYRASAMGFVFQAYNLVPVLSAEENVELPLLCQGMKPKEARKRAIEALARVGLRERSTYMPLEMSGGQQQRVAIARAIVNKPRIVWADEPTGALDSSTNTMVMDLIRHLNRTEAITFVIVTHNPAVANYADRTLYMDSGRVVSEQRRNTGGRTVHEAGGLE